MVERMRFRWFTLAALILLVIGIGFLTDAHALAQGSAPMNDVLVQVHADQSDGEYAPIWNYFGADEPNFLTAPNGQKLLGELAALSNYPVYFRPHNLLTTGNGEGSLKWGSTNVYTEKPDGTPVYDFAITDKIFDAMTNANVRPIVEIGFMPEALSAHSEPYRHNFPNGDVFTGWSYPPKDEQAWAKWEKLIEAYARHLRERYGDAVDTWLWEVWNEPDIAYWHGTPEQYDRLYDLTSAAIRKEIPQAKVGGPEATGIGDRSEPFLRQFLEHCARGKNAATGGVGAPLDFISYHPKGRPSLVDGHVVMSVATQLRSVEHGMKVVASYPEWKNTPIVLGESDPEGCGACLSPQNGYRNGPLYGASVTEATMRTYELARKYGVHVQGAVTWAFEFENVPAFAAYRALATDGIDKPVLNAFRIMGLLSGGKAGGEWIRTESTGALALDGVVAQSVNERPDVNAVATRNGKEVDVLLWNYHDADVDMPAAKIQLHVDGLKSGEVEETEFRMDATHSNAFRVWQQMGSPATPNAEQMSILDKAGQLEQTVPEHAIRVESGALSLAQSVQHEGVLLVRLREK